MIDEKKLREDIEKLKRYDGPNYETIFCDDMEGNEMENLYQFIDAVLDEYDRYKKGELDHFEDIDVDMLLGGINAIDDLYDGICEFYKKGGKYSHIFKDYIDIDSFLESVIIINDYYTTGMYLPSLQVDFDGDKICSVAIGQQTYTIICDNTDFYYGDFIENRIDTYSESANIPTYKSIKECFDEYEKQR